MALGVFNEIMAEEGFDAAAMVRGAASDGPPDVLGDVLDAAGSGEAEPGGGDVRQD